MAAGLVYLNHFPLIRVWEVRPRDALHPFITGADLPLASVAALALSPTPEKALRAS
jgi:hypothetical protein